MAGIASSKLAGCVDVCLSLVNFDVLLTVRLSIIFVINQLDAQNLVLQ